jgi:hypothetical protein
MNERRIRSENMITVRYHVQSYLSRHSPDTIMCIQRGCTKGSGSQCRLTLAQQNGRSGAAQTVYRLTGTWRQIGGYARLGSAVLLVAAAAFGDGLVPVGSSA